MDHENTDQTQQIEQAVTIEWSDQKPTELFKALVSAQAEFPAVTASDYNPHFKNRYAQYKDVVDTVRLILNKNNLIFFHTPHHEDGVLYTYIAHAESGQWMRGSLEMQPTQKTEQARGSSISYIKRYTLVAMLGLATSDDDDGNAASGNGKSSSANGSSKKNSVTHDTKQDGAESSQKITHAQLQELKNICTQRPELLDEMLKKAKILKLEDMPQSLYQDARHWLLKQVSGTDL